MVGEAGSGVACINGAAAHLVQAGDIVIVATFASYEDAEARGHQPRVVFVDKKNRPRAINARELPGPRRL
jgi:aspartate 1-decarboxylase